MRTRRRRLLDLVCVGAAAIACLPGCIDKRCDTPDLDQHGQQFDIVLDDLGDRSHLVDDHTWQSNSFQDEWLDFPPHRNYQIRARTLGGRLPTVTLAYVSPSRRPTPPPESGEPGYNFTLASGDLALFWGVYAEYVNGQPFATRITVSNNTCTQYYLRLVLVTGSPAEDGGPTDAGTVDAERVDASPSPQ